MSKSRLIPVLIPLVVAGIGVLLFFALTFSGPTLDPRPPEPVLPSVTSQVVALAPFQVPATAYGTVEPRSETNLVSEVSGRAVSVSEQLVSGGFFAAGDVLFEVDPEDYQTRLEQANAGLARAASELAFASKDYERQLDLKSRQSVSQALEDEALRRLAAARANHRDALASKSAAARDLARTKIYAPYQGRVRSENIDVGQYVNQGTTVASLYATDFVEVKLPVQDYELAFLDVNLVQANVAGESGPEVRLRAEFAGQPQTWVGVIDRIEGEIDGMTRMVNLVARVAEPYGSASGQVPLAVGLFVEAEILGRQLQEVVELPRIAMVGPKTVFVIDNDQRLRRTEVEVLRKRGDSVLVGGGLANGDRVCLTPMDDAVEGMRVRIEAGAMELSQR